MPKEMERYGTVKVISGKFKGRIGYYDDDDLIYPEGYEWSEDTDDENPENVIRVAIVYFGDFLLAKEYYGIPYDDLEYASMNDLMNRKQELSILCSQISKVSYKKCAVTLQNCIMLKLLF